MENVEVIGQQEEPEPIVILDPDQEELGKQNATKAWKLTFSHVSDNSSDMLWQINTVGAPL